MHQLQLERASGAADWGMLQSLLLKWVVSRERQLQLSCQPRGPALS